MAKLFTSSVLTIASACLLLGCSGPAKTAETLIIGDWAQVESVLVTEQGITLEISNSQTRYMSDGTSKNSSVMKIMNVPDALSTYNLTGDGTWKIVDHMLIEQVTHVDIKGSLGNPEAQKIAAQMENTILAAGDASTEILALSETKLTLKDVDTNLVLQFERQ